MKAFKSSLTRKAAAHVARVIFDAPDSAPAVDMNLLTLKSLLWTSISSALKDIEREQHFKRGWADVIAEEAYAAAVLESARAKHARDELFKPAQTGIIPDCLPVPGEVDASGDAACPGPAGRG